MGLESPSTTPLNLTMETHGLDTDTQVFFYEQDFYVLSNFSSFTLQWKGIRFDTSEAAYHWEKFDRKDLENYVNHWDDDKDKLLGQCVELQFEISHSDSAHAAFKLAEKHKHMRRPDWDNVKIDIMRQILWAKVQQHEYVRRKLLATGTRELVENSHRDSYWGWGPNRNGQNQLGKLWMEIRKVLQDAENTTTLLPETVAGGSEQLTLNFAQSQP